MSWGRRHIPAVLTLGLALAPALVTASPAGAAAYTVRVTLIDRAGRVLDDPADPALDGPVWLQNVGADGLIPLRAGDGQLQAKVPAGRYTLVTTVRSPDDSLTLLAEPKLQVTGDAAITLDARRAGRVDLGVDAPDASPELTVIGVLQQHSTPGQVAGALTTVRKQVPLYALRTEPVTDQAFLFYYREVLTSARGRYDVLVGDPHRIPADPRYSRRDAELTRVNVDIAMPGVARPGLWQLRTWLPGGLDQELPVRLPVQGPGKHTVFVNPVFPDDEPARWTDELDAVHYQELGGYADATFRPGQQVGITYGRAAFGTNASGWWDGRSGQVGLDDFVSGLGRPLSASSYSTGSGTIARDGKVIGRYDVTTDGIPFTPAKRRAHYAVEYTNRPGFDPVWTTYGAHVTGRWTFVGAPEPGTADLPLLNVRLTGPFDQLGRAPAGQRFPLTMRAGAPKPTARIVWAAVSLSYDDGRTWHQAPLARSADGSWRGMVTHPRAGNGFVATRVHARAANGATVDYTMRRAYGLVNR